MDNFQYSNKNFQSGGFLEPHRGTMILIFGILGLVFCGIFSILAWVFANEDLRKMREGLMDASGYSTTNAGKILGIIGVCFWALGLLVYVIIGFGYVMMM